MAQSQASSAQISQAKKKQKLEKSYDILTCTVKSPQFAYAHLELITTSSLTASSSSNDTQDPKLGLDALQVKSYCTAALRQFLGLTGVAVPVDILKVQGGDCWVRVPRPDLSLFAAAMTAWKGSVEDGNLRLLRVKQCSDWLGTMVGSDGQERLWN
jgi:ribonuclease P/MRP protein subunit POP8